MDKPQPVRFRIVLELTFPDADPSGPWDYDKLLEQMKKTLDSASDVKCQHVLIREALIIGSEDDYEDWRGGRKIDFSSLSANAGYIFGATFPVAAADPADLAKVWELMSKAEACELKHANVAVAIGQVLGSERDAEATIARVLILRALQKRNAVPRGVSNAIFEKSGQFPIRTAPCELCGSRLTRALVRRLSL